jgi:protein tyrosine phosphatase (PTP) superfamily phosphohydrolase (DUF442 family)
VVLLITKKKLANILRTVWDYVKLSIHHNTGAKIVGESLASIFNFLPLSATLITAGQPTEQQLAAVKDAGYKLVVNLALGSAHNALVDERSTVESLGMKYVHLPVEFDRPTLEDFDRFCTLIQENGDQPLLVHCAANFRVSAFMYLYRQIYLGWGADDAIPDLHKIWTPNAVWQQFVDEILSARDTDISKTC